MSPHDKRMGAALLSPRNGRWSRYFERSYPCLSSAKAGDEMQVEECQHASQEENEAISPDRRFLALAYHLCEQRIKIDQWKR